MNSRKATPAIDACGLSRNYGPVRAVRCLDLSVRRGELYGLVGPDGAGKTTTIACLAGLMRPTAGHVRVLGEDPMGKGTRAREHLGLMPQEYSLYGDLSIEENLQFFARLFGLSRALYRERVERLLAITRLARFTERRADALSGGMYKKLALACALLHRPSVLLLDEPTNGVDPVSRRELWELIYEFVAEGMTVLVSTAYMDEAARCHRVGLLHEGALIAEGTPRGLAQALEYDVLEVSAEDRDAAYGWLVRQPCVVAVSPEGPHLRVLATPGARGLIERELHAAGAHTRQIAAEFEDVFLARVSAKAVAA